MAHIRTALDTAYLRRDLVILLGIEPETPEIEYGWIEPTALAKGHAKIFGVRRFWEKPNQVLAQVLQLRGCLWNSFVMAASVQALLGIIESALPDLYRMFACLDPLSDGAELKAVSILYNRLGEINFSHRVLALRPEQLALLKVTGVKWSDLGETKRVMASLHMAGVRPHWVEAAQPHFA
jgi:mannose-1-phosphate guanylyltransferase